MIDTVISADDASAMRNRGQLPAGEPAINSPFLSGKQAAGLALMLTLCHAVPGQSAEHDKNKVFRFDIPAGNMASALRAFSETTDMQLSYPSVLVRDVKANALTGRYTPEQALAKLLGNSNITYRIADDQVIALAQAPKENSPGNPAPEKSVELAVMTVKADSLAPDDISPYIKSESTAGSKIPVEGTVETGFLTHQIFLGGDYTKSHFGTSSINLAGVPAIDALNPVYLGAQPAAGPARLGSHGTSELGSFAFQDIISITQEFDLTGSVRQSTYSAKRLNIANGVTSEIDTDNTSYQVGGTFHATDSIHFFAGYGEGFSPIPAVAMANGASLEPG